MMLSDAAELKDILLTTIAGNHPNTGGVAHADATAAVAQPNVDIAVISAFRSTTSHDSRTAR
jgi:hypothetical protein